MINIVSCWRLILAVKRVSLKTQLLMTISKVNSPSIQYMLPLDRKSYSYSLKPKNKHTNEVILRTSPKLLEQLNKPKIDFTILNDLCENILKDNELKPVNLGKLCQSACARHIYIEKKVDQAIQMFHYLQTLKPEDIQPSAYATLMGSFRGTGEQFEEVILEIWDKLREFSDVFPSMLLPYISEGLCETRKWKEALNLVEMNNVFSEHASLSQQKPILIRAIKDGAVDVVSSVLDSLLYSVNLGLRNEMNVLIHELFPLVKNDDIEFNMKDFCDILQILRIQPNKSVAKDIQNYFNTKMPQWNCTITSLRKRQYCISCGYRLPEAKFSETAMEGLRDQIFNKLILKSDIYLNTNPEEFQRFLNMVEKEGPFDVVLDGCNIGIGQEKVVSILKAVEYFKKNNMRKVLIIGKNHIMKWNQMNIVQENAFFFPVTNVSKDDLFILYAACQSPHTYVVSHDYYRNHLHGDIDREYYPLFYKWKFHRHIKHFKFVADRATAVMPPLIDMVPSYNKKLYHIPYINDDNRISWLCAKKL